MYLLISDFCTSGVSVQHLSGEFYPFIIEDHGNFSVQMVLSGEATGTGKSLAQSVHMRALKGGEICPTKSCTENEGYVILSRGEHIYGTYYSMNLTGAVHVQSQTVNPVK